MTITLETIPKIEKAFGVKLYDSQIQALINDNYNLFQGRHCGKTLAYTIKLALSEGEPIRIDKFGRYSDRDERETNYTYWFKGEFMEIREKLKDNGFPVRGVVNYGGKLI